MDSTTHDLAQQYNAASQSSAFFDLSDRATLLVRGEDRHSFLDGVLSASIAGMAEGSGAYAALLDPKGKYIAELKVFAVSDGILIDCPAQTVETLLATLGRYKFRAKVSFEDLTSSLQLVSVAGPKAEEVAGFQIAPGAGSLAIVSDPAKINSRWAALTGDPSDGSVWLWMDRDRSESVMQELETRGAVRAGSETLKLMRILGGVPTWGRDIDETVLPPEAGQDRSLTYEKCYPGQEVVARIHFRGHVNRLLQIFEIDSNTAPPEGSAILCGDVQAGKLTSSAVRPDDNTVWGLGYVRREVVLEGKTIVVDDGGLQRHAKVHPLPYQTVL